MASGQVQLKPLLLAGIAIAIIEAAIVIVTVSIELHLPLLLGVARLAEICAMTGIVTAWGQGLSSIGLDRAEWSHGVKRGLIWSAGFAVIAAIACVVLIIFNFNPMKVIAVSMPKEPGNILMLFLVGGIIAPVAEEIFFRGLVFGFFRRWGFPLALAVSTTLFVLIHPLGRSIPITQIVGGIVFAVAYEREGSLVTPVTIHALGNMALFSLSLLFPVSVL